MTQNLSAYFSRRKFVKSPPTVASIKSPPTYWRNLFDLRKRCPENFSCCGEDGAVRLTLTTHASVQEHRRKHLP
jgi:hypothetical protein